MIKKSMRNTTGALRKTASALLLLIAVLLPAKGFGAHDGKNVTPYGSYCKRMSHYGIHRSLIDLKEAEEALKHIYGQKGLAIKIVGDEGRFLKVNIMDKQELIDIVIFDRRTGRIRSIY